MDPKTFRRLAAVFAAVYFFSLNGLGTLPDLSVNFLLKEKMHLTPAQMAYFQAVLLLAWVVKPLWGFVSDSLPLFGSRRKSYLLLTSAIAAASWMALAVTPHLTVGFLLGLISICYMAYAFQDVVTDGLMVEAGKPDNLTGKFQSIQWAAVYSAMILTAFAGGALSDLTRKGTLSPRLVFAITALFPLITLGITALGVKEEDHVPVREAGFEMKRLFKSRDIWILSLFLFFWNFSPSFGSPFFFYAVDQLKFSGSFLGTLQGIASAAALTGSILYGRYAEKIPVRRFLIFVIFAGVGMILFHFVFFIPALISRPIFLKFVAAAFNLILGGLNALVFLTLCNLAAQVSPRYAGGTIFALLMSFYNLGLLGSSALGGLLFPYLGLKLLILISAFFSLIVLFFLPYLPIAEELTGIERFFRRRFDRKVPGMGR